MRQTATRGLHIRCVTGSQEREQARQAITADPFPTAEPYAGTRSPVTLAHQSCRAKYTWTRILDQRIG